MSDMDGEDSMDTKWTAPFGWRDVTDQQISGMDGQKL